LILRFYKPLFFLIEFVLPVYIMCYFGESINTAWNVNILRYLVTLHVVFCVNSVAHIWGDKPYDKDISPTSTYSVALFNFGEGWHNYHHVRMAFDNLILEMT
jgi:stearoyl-CoA desaturase (Delta-9 desaturase)